MSNILLLTTVSPNQKCIEWPKWLKGVTRADLFIMNPHRLQYGVEETDVVREVIESTAPTGFRLKSHGVEPVLFFRAHNEELRRQFRELLRWGKWDALVVDGIEASSPLMGDRGYEIPRSLSWVVYGLREDEHDYLEGEFEVRGLGARRARDWHQRLMGLSSEIVSAPWSRDPVFGISGLTI